MSLSKTLFKSLLALPYLVLFVVTPHKCLLATEVLKSPNLELDRRSQPAVVTFQPSDTNAQINHPSELVINLEGFDMRNNLHLLQKPQYVLDLSGDEISLETLSQLREASPFIYSLDLSETVLTNAGLEILSKFNFRNLRQLNLSGNRFDDDAMPFLSGFTSVNNLKIAYNKISVTGLRALRPLPLEYLDAGCTYLENEGIRLIPAILPKLKELDVRASGFDETVLDCFLELPQLQKLNVTRTKINPPALESFLAKTQKRTIQVQADNLLQ